MSEQPKFNEWAIVEVMGHNTFAGLVTEQTVAGAGFIRIDVPAIEAVKGRYSDSEAQPDFTKLIGTGSIYAITPCSEVVARQAAARVRTRPIHMLDIPASPAREITAPVEEDDSEERELPF